MHLPEPPDSAAGTVEGVFADRVHRFSKVAQPSITLLAGLGVAGDAHCGATVRHRSRVRRDSSQPNLRQVHLLSSELLAEVAMAGHAVAPGDMGENITTAGIDLLALPQGTRLMVGPTAVLMVTGLRNPCSQIDAFQPGLMAQWLGRTPDGALLRKAGVMAVVLTGGEVRADDTVAVQRPAPPHRALEPV